MKIILWILRLYPRAWRDRYEPEMLVLLEEYPITFLTGLDLLWGACDAWLDPYYRRAGVLSPHQRLQRVRTAIVAAFGAFPLAFSFFIFRDPSIDSAWSLLILPNSFLAMLSEMMSFLGTILWFAALIVALVLVAYRGKTSAKRVDHILAWLPFVSACIVIVCIDLFVTSVSLPISWLINVLIFGLLGIPALMALALAKGNISKRLSRLFLVLSALMIVGILLSQIVMEVAQIIASIFWLGETWTPTMIGGIFSSLVVVVAIGLLVRGFATLRTFHTRSDQDAEVPPPQSIQHIH